ncbi:MAG TPA: hypothetical protein VLT82_23375 [Myxococcaceae bacterium]|nr:hypothetical protein [Myxococcaceae bacterium]
MGSSIRVWFLGVLAFCGVFLLCLQRHWAAIAPATASAWGTRAAAAGAALEAPAMLALIAQLLLCLLAAAVVGFLVAWFLRRGQVAELTSEAQRLRALVPTGVLPSALSTRLELLARLMEEVRLKPATELAATELHRLLEAQQALQGTVTELARRSPPTPPALDLTPIVQKLESLSGDGELSSRLASVTATLAGLAEEIAALRSRPAAPPVPRAPPPRKEERDDLILIHGVGPVLQRLLHRMGIYRFEQVMSWDANDVAAVTARLPGFKGRIEREGWVESARREHRKKYGWPSPDAPSPAHSH